MNSKIKTGSMILLAVVLVAGTISMTIPSSFAQPYYPDPYAQDPYAMEKPHPKSVNVQKIHCTNSNFNVNGIEINEIPPGPPATANTEALQEDGTTNGNGNGLLDGGLNLDRNLVNVCVNFNLNEQADDARLP